MNAYVYCIKWCMADMSGFYIFIEPHVLCIATGAHLLDPNIRAWNTGYVFEAYPLLTANIQCFYTKEKPIPRTCLVMEPVLQSCYHWNLGMDKWFHLTLYTVLDMWLLIHAVIKVNQVSMAASSNINKYPGRYICATAYLCLHLEPLHWHHNERDSVSNHQPLECLFNCLIRHR